MTGGTWWLNCGHGDSKLRIVPLSRDERKRYHLYAPFASISSMTFCNLNKRFSLSLFNSERQGAAVYDIFEKIRMASCFVVRNVRGCGCDRHGGETLMLSRSTPGVISKCLFGKDVRIVRRPNPLLPD